MSQPLIARLRDALLNGNTSPVEPVTSLLPFPYHFIPGEVRTWIAKRLFRRYVKELAQWRGEGLSPYAANRSDQWSAQLSEPGEPVWQWPEGKRSAFVLSHDTDTAGMRRGVAMLAAISEKRGFRGSFSFVGEHLGDYERQITDMLAEGHDIALHDRYHDNRIAFLPEADILDRLAPMRPWIERFSMRGFRSPSWYTSPAMWSALKALGFRYDMSVLDSYPFFERGRSHGSGSFFPFFVDGLAIIPNTIPLENAWYCGFSLKETLAFWKPKFDTIARQGGLIMINAHPDRWLSGNPKAAQVLERCVDYILESHDPALLTAAQVAEHAVKQRERGATVELPGTPAIGVPRLPSDERPGFATHLNPLLQAKTSFLLQTGS